MLPCYPTPNPHSGKHQAGPLQPGELPALPGSHPLASDEAGVPSAADEAGAPRPIGPERLRALREAILNGTYPPEGAVASGLSALFRKPGPREAEGPPSPGTAS